uniref:EF-hand domain-containing protein n=1 Tax=Hyaloperonospora arabidopsidis (strain Emoy2) TaxID=559515 RepID=M4B7U2_HYAAE
MARRMAPTRAVQTYEGQVLSEKEIEEMREAFLLFDADDRGVVDFEEVQMVLQSLGLETMGQLSPEWMESRDKNSSDTENRRFVDMESFVDILGAKIGNDEVDKREEIQRVFFFFDDDKTGKISLRNLKRVVHELGETLTDAELLEMVERADLNQDGEVDADEFYTMMTKQTFT